MRKDYMYTVGPTPVPPEVNLGQAQTMMHHRSAEFSEMLGRVTEGLKYVFQTDSDVLLLSSSGTGGMEASVTNFFSAGDRVAVFHGGKFGERFVDICNVYGLDVLDLPHDWGTRADPALLEKALSEESDLKGVFLTLSETSTGIVNDVESFGRLLKDEDALFIVDTISGLGAVEFRMDEWNVDVAVSGSQKALMMPPGLAFVAVGPAARDRQKDAGLPRYYFDLGKALKALEKKPTTPYTPAVSLIMALERALDMIRDEGLDNIIERHRVMGDATRAAVEALGLRLFARDCEGANVTTSVWSPEGINSGDIVKRMRDDHGVFIAGGQSQMKGKIFRLGHVGYFDKFDILVQISALEMVLKDLGMDVALGTGVKGAEMVLGEGWP